MLNLCRLGSFSLLFFSISMCSNCSFLLLNIIFHICIRIYMGLVPLLCMLLSIGSFLLKQLELCLHIRHDCACLLLSLGCQLSSFCLGITQPDMIVLASCSAL